MPAEPKEERMELKLTMEVIKPDGSVGATMTSHYRGLEYPDVVAIEEAISMALVGLGKKAIELKASKGK